MRQLIAASILVAASIFPALAGVDKAPARLKLQQDTDHGSYIVRDDGFALYSFTGDARGADGKAPVVNCRETCLEIWTPYYTSAPPLTAKGLRPVLTGTVGYDGRLIVTYGGRPLYSYIVDNDPADTAGHGIESFNGLWQLVSPKGELIVVR